MKVFIVCLLFAGTSLCVHAEFKPVSLKCEHTITPLFVDISQPVFSWSFKSDERNFFQSAYEIIVAEKESDVVSGKGTLWSTGKVSGAANQYIFYAGPTLKSFTKYFWRVKVYDVKGVSRWSDVTWFETAALNSSDWKASWIGDGSELPENDADAFLPDRMPLFRKTFPVKRSVSSARLYISGVGYYEAFINGNKIGPHVLDPGWTAYGKQVLYSVHDVSSMLASGDNVVAMMSGNGWWNPLPIKLFGNWDIRKVQQTGRPCVKAQLHIRYDNGTTEVIATDSSWSVAPGPIYKNSVYIGEHYDARLEQKNWNKSGEITTAWRKAIIVNGPSGKLSAQRQPPVIISEIINPVRLLNPAPDTFIVDMGENFAGVARIKVQGPAGRKITLRYGEDLFKDGSLNYSTTVMTQIRAGGISGGVGAPATAWQEDSYILKGEGEEIWSPRFTFHGFRYVEITGWPGKPELNDIKGLKMHAALDTDGNFACSNEMFNEIQRVTRRTFLSNVFSVQSDCPGREKMGYGADMVVTANAFIYNFDMHLFYEKAVQDFANEQQSDGGIPEIAPFTGIADRGYGGNSGPLGWQLAFPFLQKQLYDYYGDKRIIAKYYNAFVRQMDFLESKSFQGLFHWDIGDHEALDPRAEAFSASAFYYHHAILATEFASILGRKEDSIRFAKLSDDIKSRIIKKYLVPNTGRFDNGTQAAQIFALWYKLSPEKDKTFDVLMEEFKRHNFHVSSGIFGVKMMFDVLREADRNDVAYAVANQKTYPGWGYMIEQGATTLWETWAYPEKYPSQNHPMFGSISEWFYRSLLGINPLSPGFRRIMIKPQPAGDLQWAKGSYESVQGKIVSDWKIEGNKFIITVSVPANTNAEIWVPALKQSVLTEGGKTLSSQKIKLLRNEGGYAIVEVGSGAYNFTSSEMR